MERIKMNALTLCILIFVLVCNFLFSVGISWTKYNYESYFDGYRCVPNETIFEKFNVYDSVTCGRICHVTNKCVSYLYHPDNHLCIGCRVYGAIWTGHHDELPGSVYLARQCDQEYKRVCHFELDWMIGDEYIFDKLDATICTHIIYELQTINKYPWWEQLKSHDEEKIKKLQQLKVSNPCLKILVHVSVSPVYEETWKALSFLRTYGFNGIDIPDLIIPELFSETFASKVEEIKRTFDLYGYLITAAVRARENGTEVKPLVEHLDFIVLIPLGISDFAYDKTLIYFPLYQSSQVSNGQQLTMNSNAEYWISIGVPKKKLVLGVAAYGLRFELKNEEENQIGAPAVGIVPQEKLYYEICQMQEKGLGTERWDEEQKSPYYINGKDWISYDNVRSISEKMYWLKEKGYGGAGIFRPDGDDFKPVCKSSSGPHPLLSVIYDILTSG